MIKLWYKIEAHTHLAQATNYIPSQAELLMFPSQALVVHFALLVESVVYEKQDAVCVRELVLYSLIGLD